MRRFANVGGLVLLGALLVTVCGCGGEGGPVGATGAKVDGLLPGALTGSRDVGAALTGRIVFFTLDGVRVMDANGSRQTHLAAGTHPDWSPDGRRIAFERDSQIWVMNADGTGARILTVGRPASYQPAYSPDGKKMAFGRGRGIYTANADTGKGTRLVTRDGWMPAWSPDGRKIAYSRLTGSGPWSKWCLWVVTVGGTGDRQLTTGEEMDTEPAWSPDGKWIAFNRIPEGHFDPQIFIITSAGTGLRQLTTPEAEHAAWSPDGKWIAFSSYRAGRSDIYAMPAAGGTAKRLTRTGGAWQPDWCAPR